MSSPKIFTQDVYNSLEGINRVFWRVIVENSNVLCILLVEKGTRGLEASDLISKIETQMLTYTITNFFKRLLSGLLWP